MNLTINNSTNFGAGYHMYFYTSKGAPIVSEKNMSKCLHYVEAHLNNAKRVRGKRNMDLVDTFRYGQFDCNGQRVGGDVDYLLKNKIRSVPDNTEGKVQGFKNVVTGHHADAIDKKYGEEIGRARRESRIKTGDAKKSFEAEYAAQRYVAFAPEFAEKQAVYRNDKRLAFGVVFDPVIDKKGEVKGFTYVRSKFMYEPQNN